MQVEAAKKLARLSEQLDRDALLVRVLLLLKVQTIKLVLAVSDRLFSCCSQGDFETRNAAVAEESAAYRRQEEADCESLEAATLAALSDLEAPGCERYALVHIGRVSGAATPA